MRLKAICVLLAAGVTSAASDSSIVVIAATGEAAVDGSAVPREGIGLWRVEPGSTVEAKGGFVELGIGEGCWLRLRPDASVQLLPGTEQAIEMEIQRGAAVLDLLRKPAAEAIRLKLGSSVLTTGGKGSFLVDATEGRFAVLKGKAQVEAGGSTLQLKAKTAMPADGSAQPAKLAKLEQDEFDDWREQRNDEFIRGERRAHTVAERAMRPAR